MTRVVEEVINVEFFLCVSHKKLRKRDIQCDNEGFIQQENLQLSPMLLIKKKIAIVENFPHLNPFKERRIK